MAENRLKIKIGEHEFEAEGPVDIVQAQLAAFTELVSKLPATPQKPARSEQPAEEIADANGSNGGNGLIALEKIMRADGRLISLTVRAETVGDAALLLLYGQRHFRANDSVTGGEILDGLRESGQPVPRIDGTMMRLSDEGLVITVGERRGRRYRLTNTGVARAEEVARALISIVP